LHGGEKVYSLADILAEPIDNSGYNEDYGLLGSNKSTDTEVKLFPRNSQPIVDEIQAKMKELTGKVVEVMVYGDGAFKDSVGEIWELADPFVSPGYSEGLTDKQFEIKIYYVSDIYI